VRPQVQYLRILFPPLMNAMDKQNEISVFGTIKNFVKTAVDTVEEKTISVAVESILRASGIKVPGDVKGIIQDIQEDRKDHELEPLEKCLRFVKFVPVIKEVFDVFKFVYLDGYFDNETNWISLVKEVCCQIDKEENLTDLITTLVNCLCLVQQRVATNQVGYQIFSEMCYGCWKPLIARYRPGTNDKLTRHQMSLNLNTYCVQCDTSEGTIVWIHDKCHKGANPMFSKILFHLNELLLKHKCAVFDLGPKDCYVTKPMNIDHLLVDKVDWSEFLGNDERQYFQVVLYDMETEEGGFLDTPYRTDLDPFSIDLKSLSEGDSSASSDSDQPSPEDEKAVQDAIQGEESLQEVIQQLGLTTETTGNQNWDFLQNTNGRLGDLAGEVKVENVADQPVLDLTNSAKPTSSFGVIPPPGKMDFVSTGTTLTASTLLPPRVELPVGTGEKSGPLRDMATTPILSNTVAAPGNLKIPIPLTPGTMPLNTQNTVSTSTNKQSTATKCASSTTFTKWDFVTTEEMWYGEKERLPDSKHEWITTCGSCGRSINGFMQQLHHYFASCQGKMKCMCGKEDYLEHLMHCKKFTINCDFPGCKLRFGKGARHLLLHYAHHLNYEYEAYCNHCVPVSYDMLNVIQHNMEHLDLIYDETALNCERALRDVRNELDAYRTRQRENDQKDIRKQVSKKQKDVRSYKPFKPSNLIPFEAKRVPKPKEGVHIYYDPSSKDYLSRSDEFLEDQTEEWLKKELEETQTCRVGAEFTGYWNEEELKLKCDKLSKYEERVSKFLVEKSGIMDKIQNYFKDKKMPKSIEDMSEMFAEITATDVLKVGGITVSVLLAAALAGFIAYKASKKLYKVERENKKMSNTITMALATASKITGFIALAGFITDKADLGIVHKTVSMLRDFTWIGSLMGDDPTDAFKDLVDVIEADEETNEILKGLEDGSISHSIFSDLNVVMYADDDFSTKCEDLDDCVRWSLEPKRKFMSLKTVIGKHKRMSTSAQIGIGLSMLVVAAAIFLGVYMARKYEMDKQHTFQTEGKKHRRDLCEKCKELGKPCWTVAYGRRFEKRNECVHVASCPLKLSTSPTMCCGKQCGGHHCTHWAQCTPEANIDISNLKKNDEITVDADVKLIGSDHYIVLAKENLNGMICSMCDTKFIGRPSDHLLVCKSREAENLRENSPEINVEEDSELPVCEWFMNEAGDKPYGYRAGHGKNQTARQKAQKIVPKAAKKAAQRDKKDYMNRKNQYDEDPDDYHYRPLVLNPTDRKRQLRIQKFDTDIYSNVNQRFKPLIHIWNKAPFKEAVKLAWEWWRRIADNIDKGNLSSNKDDFPKLKNCAQSLIMRYIASRRKAYAQMTKKQLEAMHQATLTVGCGEASIKKQVLETAHLPVLEDEDEDKVEILILHFLDEQEFKFEDPKYKQLFVFQHKEAEVKKKQRSKSVSPKLQREMFNPDNQPLGLTEPEKYSIPVYAKDLKSESFRFNMTKAIIERNQKKATVWLTPYADVCANKDLVIRGQNGAFKLPECRRIADLAYWPSEAFTVPNTKGISVCLEEISNVPCTMFARFDQQVLTSQSVARREGMNLFYSHSTKAGNCGSPIISNGKIGTNQLIGIHDAGESKSGNVRNRAIYLNTDRMLQILEDVVKPKN